MASAKRAPLLAVEPWLGVVTKCGNEKGKAFATIDEVRRELFETTVVVRVILSEDWAMTQDAIYSLVFLNKTTSLRFKFVRAYATERRQRRPWTRPSNHIRETFFNLSKNLLLASSTIWETSETSNAPPMTRINFKSFWPEFINWYHNSQWQNFERSFSILDNLFRPRKSERIDRAKWGQERSRSSYRWYQYV